MARYRAAHGSTLQSNDADDRYLLLAIASLFVQSTFSWFWSLEVGHEFVHALQSAVLHTPAGRLVTAGTTAAIRRSKLIRNTEWCKVAPSILSNDVMGRKCRVRFLDMLTYSEQGGISNH